MGGTSLNCSSPWAMSGIMVGVDVFRSSGEDAVSIVPSIPIQMNRRRVRWKYSLPSANMALWYEPNSRR